MAKLPLYVCAAVLCALLCSTACSAACADINCKECDENRTDICVECQPYYGLKMNACERCTDPNCMMCGANPGVCTSCSALFKPNSDGVCVRPYCNAAVLHCEYCTEDNGTVCMACSDGYTADSSEERKCVKDADLPDSAAAAMRTLCAALALVVCALMVA